MKKRGFTLVEIAIVLTVLGFLSALTVPSVIRARKRTQETIVQRDFTTLSGAIEMFQWENTRYPRSWEELRPYVKNVDSLKERYELNPNL